MPGRQEGQDAQGRYKLGDETRSDFNLASAARTATGAGTAFSVDDVISVSATLAVTNVSGTTPTLDVALHTTVDGTNFYAVDAFPQVTGANTPTVTIATVTAGDDDPATDEVQSVTLANADGGTFTLTYSGQTTAAIAYNATAVAVQAALIALSNLAPADVVVTGSAGGPYTLTFGGTLAATNVDAVTASAAGLSATDAASARAFGPLGTSAKWVWTVAGDSPSFTFSIASTANRDD